VQYLDKLGTVTKSRYGKSQDRITVK